MSKIQDIIWGMTDENKSAAAISETYSATGQAETEARRCWDKLRATYAKDLRRYVSRKATRMVFKHSQSWGVEVDVFPLHDHVAHTTGPLVEVEWKGRHGEIKLKCWAITPERVEQFLERFEAVVIATQLHQERIMV